MSEKKGFEVEKLKLLDMPTAMSFRHLYRQIYVISFKNQGLSSIRTIEVIPRNSSSTRFDDPHKINTVIIVIILNLALHYICLL